MATAVAALPEIGLTRIRGNISIGIFTNCIIGDRHDAIKSKKPDSLRKLTAKKRPIRLGKILTTVVIPSFAPERKLSKTLTFSARAYDTMKNIVKGTAIIDM